MPKTRTHNLSSVWKTHRCGDMLAVYSRSAEGIIQFSLLPAKGPGIPKHRETLEGTFEFNLLKPDSYPQASTPEPLVQVKFTGTNHSGGFAAGATMRNSPDALSFRSSVQKKTRSEKGFTVTTRLTSKSYPGIVLEHILVYRRDEPGVRVSSRIHNNTRKKISLDLLSSFILGGITPYHRSFAPGRLYLHRFRSWWSAEGRHVCTRLEELGLERAWANWGGVPTRVEKFGQIGSMPVRDYFPSSLIEDREAGVFWGAQLAHPGSWQMELVRSDDRVHLSGGQADFDYGHWRKDLLAGASWTSPEAFLTVAHDTLDSTCQRLTRMQETALKKHGNRTESALPLICNDWCTNWGDTTHDKMIAIARKLRGSGIKYLVIDDGWQKRKGKAGQHIGDWDVDPRRFPDMKATCDAIRAEGMIPGIWFEFENISLGNRVWDEEIKHQLQRDGRILQVGGKRFWDFRDPWVHRYLRKKVIGLLKNSGFGYIKVDYNDTIGVGADGPDSLGESLRAHLEGVQQFFTRIRQEVPGIVIENCSSGGHRLEPSMMALADMASFSDAHECQEIPIIALNVLRLIPARMSQIWAVLHRKDSDRRLIYSLSAGFMGRLCISGEIAGLNSDQMRLVEQALGLYKKSSRIIRDGINLFHENHNRIYRQPEGWQASVRYLPQGKHCLVVFHWFGTPPSSGSIPLPPGNWHLEDTFQEKGEGSSLEIRKGRVSWKGAKAFSGKVLLLKK